MKKLLIGAVLAVCSTVLPAKAHVYSLKCGVGDELVLNTVNDTATINGVQYHLVNTYKPEIKAVDGDVFHEYSREAGRFSIFVFFSAVNQIAAVNHDGENKNCNLYK